ncbi:claudin-18-like isoform X2 [Acipenser ruthenus]|nr:claudin-18-like isoform X2 [Acipenser ruthenus]
MIVGIVLGVIGALISIFALKCIRMGNMEDAMKANMTLTSGILFVVGGVCGIAGVSVFANLIVTNFMFTTTTATMQGSLQPRYTFGSALFMGWVGGAVLVVGGIMMCVACKGMAPEKTHYNAVAYKASRPNTIYKSGDERSRRGFDDDYKKSTTRSDDGRQTQPSRFDYV